MKGSLFRVFRVLKTFFFCGKALINRCFWLPGQKASRKQRSVCTVSGVGSVGFRSLCFRLARVLTLGVWGLGRGLFPQGLEFWMLTKI